MSDDDEYPTLNDSMGAVIKLVSELTRKRDALKARVAELEAARQWQPIESCPLDTQVLLLVNGTLPDIGYRRSYGLSLRGRFEFTGTEGYYPTHWQPLPELPK